LLTARRRSNRSGSAKVEPSGRYRDSNRVVASASFTQHGVRDGRTTPATAARKSAAAFRPMRFVRSPELRCREPFGQDGYVERAE